MFKRNWKLATVLLAVFMLGMAFTWVGPLNTFKTESVSASPVLYSEDTVTGIYEKTSPSVVAIQVTQDSGTRGNLFSREEGSGFLVDKEGNILTNNHVVDGASRVRVTFKNGNTADASVVGTDTIHDLAIIKVDASALPEIAPLTLGDSGILKPGQMAIAIGAPYGLEGSITVGVISGLNRNLSSSSLTGMLQTDAAINPGNSGGPLLNAAGEVIGINTAIEAQYGANSVGFAVPSNTVKKVLDNLKAGKKVQRVWLGISGMAITEELAKHLELSVNEGVYVVSVTSGSPADKAGLKGSGTGSDGAPAAGGDIITAVNGKPVKTVPEITACFAEKQVGDQVTLTVIRSDATMDVNATLGAWPSDTAITNQFPNIIPNIPNPWRGRQNNDTPLD